MNTPDILKYGHQTVLETLEGLPKEQWLTPGVCGIWSVKDIIAHLASFEHLLIDVLKSLLNEGPTPVLDSFRRDFIRFNDIEVANRQNWNIDEVLADYQDTYARAAQLLARVPADLYSQNGTLPWYGPDYSLNDFIVYTFYGHKREHSAQIAVYQDQLAAQGTAQEVGQELAKA